MQEDKQTNQQPSSNWQFNATITPGTQNTPQQNNDHVSWSASEFIAFQKSGGWYMLVILGVVALAGLVFLFTQDYFSAGAIVVAGLLFVIFAGRKPRVLNYSIDSGGIAIGAKKYQFKDFRSFSLIEETHMRSVMLTPLKRFMPAISMYFEPADEQKITEALSGYLPYEDRKQDPVDKVMQRLRF